MLDSILPAYLLTLSGVTSSSIGTKVFRNRVPQGVSFPYIVVGDANSIDIGQVVQGNLSRELGSYSIIVTHDKNFNAIDSAVNAIVTALKTFKNGFIPSNSVFPRVWVQCFFVQDRQQFNYNPKDGDEEPMLGYTITVRAAYDTILTS